MILLDRWLMVTSPQMITVKASWWVWCVSAFLELFDTVVDKTVEINVDNRQWAKRLCSWLSWIKELMRSQTDPEYWAFLNFNYAILLSGKRGRWHSHTRDSDTIRLLIVSYQMKHIVCTLCKQHVRGMKALHLKCHSPTLHRNLAWPRYPHLFFCLFHALLSPI